MPAIVDPSNGIKRIVGCILISIWLLFSVIANSYAETAETKVVGKAAAGYGEWRGGMAGDVVKTLLSVRPGKVV
ncbi:MAG: hypothetical protein WA140_10960 [Geobacteraceae bacterium]